jgi:hypothetical protein
MQREYQVGACRYRVTEANFKIVGIEVQVAEKFGQRSPVVYWRPVWRPGRAVPRGRCLLPVVEAAQARLASAGLPLTVADQPAMKLIRWLVDSGREELPAWVWPRMPRPRGRPQQRWLKRQGGAPTAAPGPAKAPRKSALPARRGSR